MTTAPKPARAHLRSADGYALEVTLASKGRTGCVRTSFRHPTGNGGSSFETTAVCEAPQDGSDDGYDRAVYRWRGDDEALLVDFPKRCGSLRITGQSSKVAFSCSRVMPGVRITAIPEGRDLQIIDGAHKFDLDLRRPCSKAKVACSTYQ